SAAPVRPDTAARFGSLAPLLLTAGAECGSPSPRSLPRNYHRPTGAGPAPIPPPHTAARSAQTTARTASTLETVRAGSWFSLEEWLAGDGVWGRGQRITVLLVTV